MSDTKTKPREFWFHIDDARSQKECEGRDSSWRPFIDKPVYDAVVSERDSQNKAPSKHCKNWMKALNERDTLKAENEKLQRAFDQLSESKLALEDRLTAELERANRKAMDYQNAESYVRLQWQDEAKQLNAELERIKQVNREEAAHLFDCRRELAAARAALRLELISSETRCKDIDSLDDELSVAKAENQKQDDMLKSMACGQDDLSFENTRLKAETDLTYKAWCGRDYMHLPLNEAVGQRVMKLHDENDRLTSEIAQLNGEIAKDNEEYAKRDKRAGEECARLKAELERANMRHANSQDMADELKEELEVAKGENKSELEAHHRVEQSLIEQRNQANYELTCYRLDGPAHTLADQLKEMKLELEQAKIALLHSERGAGELVLEQLNEIESLKEMAESYRVKLQEIAEHSPHDSSCAFVQRRETTSVKRWDNDESFCDCHRSIARAALNEGESK